jgi:predicted nucleotidyltransferase
MLSTEQVRSLLRDLKADLKTALGDKLEELVLFGSYSRGDYSKYSDIDLIILVKDELTRSENSTVDRPVSRYSLRYDNSNLRIGLSNHLILEYQHTLFLECQRRGY